MKSWRFDEFGKIENLKLGEIPIPEPAEGEALVKIEYAALNPADRFMVEGLYPRPGKPPFAVGRDGSGTIETPSAAGRFAKGERVIVLRGSVGVTREGTLAEYVAVPEDSLAPLPEGWSMQEGAAGPLTLLTAWQALVIEGRCSAGKTVLITGASGGVGTAALLLAKGLGARVVALSRSEAKRERLKELGADIVWDTEDPNLVKNVREAMGKSRADIVVETLAGPFLPKSLALTGSYAKICVIGLLAGAEATLNMGHLMFKRTSVIGIAVGEYTPEGAREAWDKIVETLGEKGLRPLIDKAYSMGQVQEAFAHLKKGPMGKVLVGPMGG